MPKKTFRCARKGLLGITVCLLLWSRAAAADTSSVTLGTASLTFTEGSTIYLDYSFTNNSGSDQEITLLGGTESLVSGDALDEIGLVVGPSNYGSCSGIIADSSSCNFFWTLYSNTFEPSGMPDGNSALVAFSFNLEYVPPPGEPGGANVLGVTTNITIADPGATTCTDTVQVCTTGGSTTGTGGNNGGGTGVPEPSSLAVLLVGPLLILARRRWGRLPLE